MLATHQVDFLNRNQLGKNVPNIFGPPKGVYGQYLANNVPHSLYTQVKKTSYGYAYVDRVHTLNRK